MTGRAPRVVLDTNVWLDLLVFADPRAAGLDAALRSGALVAVSDGACTAEWQRVLGYPQLALEPARRAALEAAFARMTQPLTTAPPQRPLPRCADPDDQKFLELALVAGARWLVSRDRALLSLARRTARGGLFDIVTPQHWPSPAATAGPEPRS
jgi:putative PIN family toxin of toxin-antitoxin system